METIETFTIDDTPTKILLADGTRASVSLRVRGGTPVLVGPNPDPTVAGWPILPDELFTDTLGAQKEWWAVVESGGGPVTLHAIVGYR